MNSERNRPNDSPKNEMFLGPNFSMYDQSNKKNLLNKIQLHVKKFTDHDIDDLINGIDVCKNCFLTQEYCRKEFRSRFNEVFGCSFFSYLTRAVKIIKDKEVPSREDELFLRDIELFLDKVEELY